MDSQFSRVLDRLHFTLVTVRAGHDKIQGRSSSILLANTGFLSIVSASLIYAKAETASSLFVVIAFAAALGSVWCYAAIQSPTTGCMPGSVNYDEVMTKHINAELSEFLKQSVSDYENAILRSSERNESASEYLQWMIYLFAAEMFSSAVALLCWMVN